MLRAASGPHFVEGLAHGVELRALSHQVFGDPPGQLLLVQRFRPLAVVDQLSDRRRTEIDRTGQIGLRLAEAGQDFLELQHYELPPTTRSAGRLDAACNCSTMLSSWSSSTPSG